MLVRVGVRLVAQASGEVLGLYAIYHRSSYEGVPDQYLEFTDGLLVSGNLSAYLFPCLRFSLLPFFLMGVFWVLVVYISFPCKALPVLNSV